MYIDQQLKRIFKENGYPVLAGEEADQLALDSLQFISIICDIESELNVSVPDNYLSGEGLDTYLDIYSLIETLCSQEEINK